MERFGRSWDLIKSCFGVLHDDRELLLFPVLSGISTLMVLATFALPMLFARVFEHGFMPFNVVIVFLFYLCQYAVIFFFNSALVGAALIRLRGGSPTFSDGMAIARQHSGAILGYAAIAATVGVLLKTRRRRNGLLGNMLRSVAGMAWTLSTFLVVPVLVSRKLGPIDAIKESASLLKNTWGENLIGTAGLWLGFGAISFIYVLASLALVFGASMVSTGFAIALAVVLAVGLLMIGIVKSAISAIYTAVLYRYAADGQAPEGFDARQLELAFGRQ